MVTFCEKAHGLNVLWNFHQSEPIHSLAQFKEYMISQVNEDYGTARRALFKGYTAAEVATFPTQRKEAANPDGPTPFIDALVAGSGKVTRAMMIDKINSKGEAFDKAMDAILGQKERLTDKINAAASIDELKRLIPECQF